MVYSLLLLCGLAAVRPVPPVLAQARSIVVLGDSITALGARPGGYVWRIAHYLNVLYPEHPIQVLGRGVSGNTADDMRARFRRDVLDPKPDLLLLNAGINEVRLACRPGAGNRLPVSLARFRDNMDAMIREARSAGIRVVVLSTTVCGEKPDSYPNRVVMRHNAITRRLAREHGCLYIDLYARFQEEIRRRRKEGLSGNVLTVDGMHLNMLGDELVATTVLQRMGVSAEDLRLASRTADRKKLIILRITSRKRGLALRQRS